MALVIRSSAAQSASAFSVSGLLVKAPTGIASGDLWIVGISLATITASPTITTLAGWTLVKTSTTDDGTNFLKHAVYYKIAGAGEGNVTFAYTGNDGAYCTESLAAYIIAPTGTIDTKDSTSTGDGSGDPTTIAFSSPSVVASFSDSTLLLWYCNNAKTTWTPPPGTTELQDANAGPNNSSNISQEMDFVLLNGAGPTIPYVGTPAAAGLASCIAVIAKEKQDTRRPHIKIAGVSSNATIMIKESL